MKRCKDCGASVKPGKACSGNHVALIWSEAAIPVMYRVAAWIFNDKKTFGCAWEYVKPRGQDDDFFDIHRALLFAKRVFRRKNVGKVEVRIEMTVQSFPTHKSLGRGTSE